MFVDYLNEICEFSSHEKVMIFDLQGIITEDMISTIKEKFNYQVIEYEDVEYFRYLFETKIKVKKERYLVFVKTDIYVPYDIRQMFSVAKIAYDKLFPRLNSYILRNSYIFDMDLLYIAHGNLYTTLQSETETSKFLVESLYSGENVQEYSDCIVEGIRGLLSGECSHLTWRKVSLLYAKLDHIKHKAGYIDGIDVVYEEIQRGFQLFVLEKYSGLSSMSAHHGPVLLNKGMDYIFNNSKKPALIVMDGMSIGDWLIIAEDFRDIQYKYNSTYAIIPTITAISRQSLLSSKLPVELERPFNLTQEKKMFFENCMNNGYKEDEIQYFRGYDIDLGYKEKCICVIINDIDDLVHSQRQGSLGMYNDVKLLSKSGKVAELVKKLYKQGFDVFIGSDHGHKEAVTIGNPKGAGVELETKSKKAIIMKDFGNHKEIKREFGMIEYPQYYLPKDFRYLLCEHNEALGAGDATILSHGGISIEEVIVPFITIEGVRT